MEGKPKFQKKKRRGGAGEQVKPGAGRSAGSYKFPYLLWGPQNDMDFWKSEASPSLKHPLKKEIFYITRLRAQLCWQSVE